MPSPLIVTLALALGVTDRGIFSDLDGQVTVAAPPIDAVTMHAVVDDRHHLLVLYQGAQPIKVYPVPLRPADLVELGPVLALGSPRQLAPGEIPAPGDRDDDGIPDPLDVLIGAKKVALNGAAYTEGYMEMGYPNGDVPRGVGVCTDVIVRALRNAGVDLQAELHEDIARAPRAYPMVKHRDPAIDQRRVGTILPWFARHWERHGTDVRSTDDPFLPGDVIFMDTFPRKPGPEHVGIISDRRGPSGLPLVINNWTDGYHEAELDLLYFVPVTDRFRNAVKRLLQPLALAER